MRRRATIWIAGLALAAGQGLAASPQPARAAPIGMYAGRWYQIAQIAKTNRHPCPGGTEDFSANGRGGLAVTLTCRQPSGASHQVKAGVTIVPNSGNARFKISFFGGLISQEYLVLDHAADLSWAVMATPGGNYLWLLARRPVLDPVTFEAADGRIKALGYDPTKLIMIPRS